MHVGLNLLESFKTEQEKSRHCRDVQRSRTTNGRKFSSNAYSRMLTGNQLLEAKLKVQFTVFSSISLFFMFSSNLTPGVVLTPGLKVRVGL